MAEQIYKLMGDAMRKISAISKDSVNQTQGFKYRGIDAVMNALYPVMSELGLFIVPEVLEQTREERTSVKTYNNIEKKTTLLYSILKIRYTMYAPDGSNVSCVVVGEGMDSGDKASNKALAVGLKYACFQMFMIPTEEMIDPDSESHEVELKTPAPKPTPKPAPKPSPKPAATVATAQTIPQPDNPVQTYLARERTNLQKARGISAEENGALFTQQLAILRKNGLVPNKALSGYTMPEAEDLIGKMYTRFAETGLELKDA
jgi:hypothetical protein